MGGLPVLLDAEGVEPRWGNTLNAAGQLLVVGENAESDGVWSIGSEAVVRLDPLPGPDGPARAFAINEKGTIVGGVDIGGSDKPNRHILLSPEGALRLLPVRGRTLFNDLNERDEAVGIEEVWGGSSSAILWTPQGGLLTLDGLAQGTSKAAAIKASGFVVGVSTAADGRSHPVRWMAPDRRLRTWGSPRASKAATRSASTTAARCWSISGAAGRPRPSTGPRNAVIRVPEGYFSVAGIGIDREGVLTADGWLIGLARLKDRPDSWRGFVARPVR